MEKRVCMTLELTRAVVLVTLLLDINSGLTVGPTSFL